MSAKFPNGGEGMTIWPTVYKVKVELYSRYAWASAKQLWAAWETSMKAAAAWSTDPLTKYIVMCGAVHRKCLLSSTKNPYFIFTICTSLHIQWKLHQRQICKRPHHYNSSLVPLYRCFFFIFKFYIPFSLSLHPLVKFSLSIYFS